jgi:hypothetical protein
MTCTPARWTAPLRPIALLLGAILVAVASRTAQADVAPLGAEFLVNTYTTQSQNRPAAAADGGGNFVVVWDSGLNFGPGPDGDARGVFAQRYDSAGLPIATEFQVNTFTPGQQVYAAPSTGALGDFVVVWQSGSYSAPGPDGSLQGIAGRRFDAAGVPLGGEFQVNTYTTGQQTRPAVAHGNAGNFVVVWQSGPYYGAGGPDGSLRGIFAQRYDSSGSRVGTEFRVNTYTTGPQSSPAIAAVDAGHFVVVWVGGSYSSSQDGNYTGIFAQRLDTDGSAIGTEFQINTYTTGYQVDPRVAADGAGNFVVVWTSSPYYTTGQDGSSRGVFGQRFDGSGTAVGGEFQANTYTTGLQDDPAVAVDPISGTFVVAWRSGYYYGGSQDGDGEGVFGQHFASDGTPIGPEFQVNTHTTDVQHRAAVAADGTGRFVVAWESGGYPAQDGYSFGVFGQRLATTALKPAVPVSGARLTLKENPADAERKAILVRSTDGDIALGDGNSSGDDPTLTGGRLRVRSAGFDHTYELPAANWFYGGQPGLDIGYLYRDRRQLAGPIRSVLVRNGRLLRVTGRGSLLGHDLSASPDPVIVVLQIGAIGERHCLQFGGSTRFVPGRLYRATGAPPPSPCPP